MSDRRSTECNASIKYGNYLFTLAKSSDIASLSGKISDKKVIYPVLAYCDKFLPYPLAFSVKLSFQNPDTYLDTRQVLSLTMRPIFIGITSVLIAGWLVFLFFRRSSITKLHITITVLFFAYLLFLSFDYEALRRESSQDNPKTFSFVLDVIQAIYATLLFGTLILVAGGWCFIHTEFSIKNIILSYLAPAVVCFSEFWGKHVSSSIESVFVLLFELVGLFASFWIMFRNTELAKKHILAHLYVIDRSGIEATSTPVYIKLQIYTFFFYFVVGALLLYFIIIIFLMFFDTDFWIQDFISDLLQTVLYIGIGFIFRPRGQDIDDLLKADDNRGDDREVIDLEDLENIDREEFLSPRNDKQIWKPGDRLPLEPRIKDRRPDSKPINNNNLESYNEQLLN